MTESQVREVLNSLSALPFPVSSWEVETGTDSLGTDAIWVWAVVDGDLPSLDQVVALREQIRSALEQRSPSGVPWVYVRLRHTSEV